MSRPSRPVIAIVLIVLFEGVSAGMIIPILPGMVGRIVGLGASQGSLIIGLVLSSSLVTMFIFSQMLGRISDRFGRRPLILLTLGGFVAAYLVMAVADSVWVLFLAQAIAGFCAASTGVGRAYVAEVTSPENRAQTYGIMSGAAALGIILGPVIGGRLGEISQHLPFFAAACVTSSSLLFAFFALPESLDPEERRSFSWRAATPLASVPTMLSAGPVARAVLIASLIEALAINVPSETGALVLFMQNTLHWNTTNVGLWLTCLGAGTVLGQGALTPLVIRLFGDRASWQIGISATAVVFALAGFIHLGWQMYILVVAYSLLSFVAPAAIAIVSRSVAGNKLGELNGAFISLSSLIKGVAITIGVWVYGYFTGPHAPFQLAGAIFFLAALFQIPAVIYGITALARRPEGEPLDADSLSGEEA